jgi:hypothetical protein
MDITYEDIINMLISEEIGGKQFPDGTSHSYPVIGMEEGVLVDCFFIYHYIPAKNEFTLPTQKIAIDSYNKKIVYYGNIGTDRAESAESQATVEIVSDYSKEERWVASKEYADLYTKVRTFAYLSQLSPEQRKTLFDYLKVFSVLIPKNQKAYYVELSPSFFEWMTACLK